MQQYLNLLWRVWNEGVEKPNRTGIPTRALFGQTMRFDLSEGFPIVTTKKVWFLGAKVELCWFLRGGSDTKYLHDHDVHFWDAWADEAAGLGPVYGKQWRNWDTPGYGDTSGSIDQLAEIEQTLIEDLFCRRMMLSSWNVADLSLMGLPPCHFNAQFLVSPAAIGDLVELNCVVSMRSLDMFIGAPFDICTYAILTHILAMRSGLEVGELIFHIGDCHIYTNHEEQVLTQLERTPFPLPVLLLDGSAVQRGDPLEEINPEDIGLMGYQYYPAIKAEIAI